MSEIESSEWYWQGFFGPMQLAITAKQQTDESVMPGAWLPKQGEPPLSIDAAGLLGMIAVMVRRGNSVAVPAGMTEANPALVGRLIGG